MPSISNDNDLRKAIEGLDFEQQRTLGVRFAESVIGFTDDNRLKRALRTALDPESNPEEIEEAYKTAKAISTATYTVCGRDTDWMAQAEHFVAAALQAALAPPELHPGKSTPAWRAAMHARMAFNCAMMESGEAGVDNEAQRQYQIAHAVLG